MEPVSRSLNTAERPARFEELVEAASAFTSSALLALGVLASGRDLLPGRRIRLVQPDARNAADGCGCSFVSFGPGPAIRAKRRCSTQFSGARTWSTSYW